VDFKDYQRQAQRTVRGGRARELQLDNWALGLAGEAGEVADVIKKHVHHSHVLDVDKVSDELGDVLWYVSVMATECGLLGHPLAPDAMRRQRRAARRLQGGSGSMMDEQEAKKTHPGFTITCDECGSKVVIVDNTLGFSDTSGAWGDVSLICQECHTLCELTGT